MGDKITRGRKKGNTRTPSIIFFGFESSGARLNRVVNDCSMLGILHFPGAVFHHYRAKSQWET
jgi:hypothetical protein